MRLTLLLRCAATYFALVFGAGFVFGALRVSLVVPRIGERLAELAEMPLMAIVIYLAAGFVVRRHGHAFGRRGWALVGVLALALVVAAELLLAAVLGGGDVRAVLAARDPVSGAAYGVLLIVFAAMPWLRAGVSGGYSAASARVPRR